MSKFVVDGELLDCVIGAMIARARGDNKDALKLLDEALKPYGSVRRELAMARPKRGRKRLAAMRDPDALAVELMELRSKRTGETRAKKLARFVLRVDRDWRRVDKLGINESDVKRLADKWKANREIKSD